MRVMISFLTFLILMLFSCQNGDTQQTNAEEANSANNEQKVSVLEVLQASQYTYLKVKDNNQDYWIAVTKLNAKEGDEYYIGKKMQMNNFKSKDLDRTFDTVFFVQEISKNPIMSTPPAMTSSIESRRPVIEKQEINVEKADGGVTVSELFAGAASYAGQTVKIKGKVIKVNNGIMGRNWVHIQDGTSDNGKFDLTVTTDANVTVGQIVTFEGVIATNKDFGAGYAYEVLMEQAKSLNTAKM